MNERQSQMDSDFSTNTRELLDRSRHMLRVPDGYFESREALIKSAIKTEFDVPLHYFENQSSRLAEALQSASKRNTVRFLRSWLIPAAAAVVAGILFLVLPEKEKSVSFAEQLEQTPIEYEDLEEIEFDEEVLDEFIVLDTVVPDTVSADKTIPAIQDFKPSKGQSVISWDDISADDIEEYLKEEETLDIIDEL